MFAVYIVYLLVRCGYCYCAFGQRSTATLCVRAVERLFLKSFLMHNNESTWPQAIRISNNPATAAKELEVSDKLMNGCYISQIVPQ